MKMLRFVMSLFVTGAVWLGQLGAASPALAQTGCMTSSPGSADYTLTICFTAPSNGSVLTGPSTVSVSVSSTGTFPGVQRMVFYLNGAYLLTDYQAPYTFTLPTTYWADGGYLLSVEALLRDTSVTQQLSISVRFNNGITSPPVNTNTFQPTAGRQPPDGEPFIVAAGGDGASGEIASGQVTDLLASANPNLFLWLGDVMEKGSMAEFYNWYGVGNNYFGQFRSITNPTIGNHEYENGVAPGYFFYWDNIPNYYSYDAHGWHFVSLNANSAFMGVDANSAQYQWLAQDLAAHAGACTIVYYHQPLFNIGPQGPATQMFPIWALMAQNGVDIVINGHDHNYQRWVPLDGSGQPSPNGITEFVAGATGHGTTTFVTTDTRVAYANDTNPGAYGALFLQLNPGGANFSYRNINNTVLDSGVVSCANTTDIKAPSIPTGLTATAASATQVDLAWTASTDNVGVAGYSIYRNGTLLTTVGSSVLSYSDTSVSPATPYQYQVDAFDPAGNHSARSASIQVTTPDLPSSLTFVPVADTYVNAASPASNYGTATSLKVDASPDVHSYIRFDATGLAGRPIRQARLLVYSSSSASQGFQTWAVADSSWDERAMNYTNAPALGNVLASTGAVAAGSWATFDVTAYLTGEGSYSFGVTTPSSTASSMSAREGAYPPQLILDLGTIVSDTQPPTVPTGLTATATSATQVDLAWNASSDNVGVAGYTVYRNGAPLTSVGSSALTYSDTTVSPANTYQYQVDAFDLAGNHSARSAPTQVTTPDLPSSLTFVPVADTYVNAASPASNYGTATSLKVDASPDVHSYLRFNAAGLAGKTVVNAQLKVFLSSKANQGLQLYSVGDNIWDERAMNYTNAPALGNVLASTGAVAAGSWATFDVTAYLTGEGTYSFGITTPSKTASNIDSRETGANAPQLILTLGSQP